MTPTGPASPARSATDLRYSEFVGRHDRRKRRRHGATTRLDRHHREPYPGRFVGRILSTCPPVSITLNVPNTGGLTNVTVNQNNTQPLSATALDINGKTLTRLALDFLSTTPTTIPAVSTGTVTPTFPGAASVTAICQPPNCNPSGLFGNGKPIASNPVNVTTPGANSTLLWIGSTQSRYILLVDFTNQVPSAPVRLPYAPNSMVISNDGSTQSAVERLGQTSIGAKSAGDPAAKT